MAKSPKTNDNRTLLLSLCLKRQGSERCPCNPVTAGATEKGLPVGSCGLTETQLRPGLLQCRRQIAILQTFSPPTASDPAGTSWWQIPIGSQRVRRLRWHCPQKSATQTLVRTERDGGWSRAWERKEVEHIIWKIPRFYLENFIWIIPRIASLLHGSHCNCESVGCIRWNTKQRRFVPSKFAS